MKAVIFPYNLGSQSARNLSEKTGFLRVKADGKFLHTKNHLVINYGSSAAGRTVAGMPILNRPEAVATAIDKLATLNCLSQHNVPVPNYSTDRNVALDWLNAGAVVFVRTKLRSSGGDGIIILKRASKDAPPTQLEEVDVAPLYTKLFSKDKEYRVHVFKGRVIDVVQKRKTNDFEGERNPYIRNHDNGWVFARENVDASQEVKDVAIHAVDALGLDFGAVDLAVDKKGNIAVFEVNTAPGLEGTTVDIYAQTFVQYLKQQQNGRTLEKTAFGMARR